MEKFLSQGLHSEHIEVWKKSMQTGLEPATRSTPERAEQGFPVRLQDPTSLRSLELKSREEEDFPYISSTVLNLSPK